MDLTPKSTTESFDELLLPYYFGTLEEPLRGQLEQQLLESPDLLGKFVSLKRTLELGDVQTAPRPSSLMKQRLRQSVAKRFQPNRITRIWEWFRQPIPLYQGLVVALGLILLLALTAPSSPTQSIQPGPLIDSSSSGSEQLGWN